MPPVSGERLAALCGEADRDTVTAFVADLYEARGYEVDRSGEGVLRLQPGGRVVVVRPTGDCPVPAERDAVVTAGSPDAAPTDSDEATGSVDVVDAETLSEHLAYAVDRDVGRDLLVTHLGADPATEDTEGAGNAGEEDGSNRESGHDTDGKQPAPEGHDRNAAPGGWLAATVAGPDTSGKRHTGIGGWIASNRRLLAAVAVVVVAIGALGWVVLLPPGGGTLGTTSADSAIGTPTPAPTGTATPMSGGDRNGEAIATARTSAAETPERSLTVASEELEDAQPPGVGEAGLTDLDRLLAAHQAHLSKDSHTTTVGYREFEDGQLTGAYVETIRVESRQRYSVSVSTTGTLETAPRVVVGVDVFSDGNQTWFRSPASHPLIQSRLTTDRIGDRTVRYLRWSLSVEESTLRDRIRDGDRSIYRITTDGDPYDGIRNASGTVYVTDEGLVTLGRWTYRTEGDGTRVEFAVRTDEVGTTTASRPLWADPTANEDAGETGSPNDDTG